MKLKYITKGIIPALAVVLSLSSCLKDDNINQDFDHLQPMVGINDASPSGVRTNSTSVAVVGADESVVVNLELGFLSDKDNPGTTVNLEVDGSALTGFPATYNQLGANFFNLPSSVTIPAGEKTVTFPVTIKPAALIAADPENAVKLFAIPIKVSSVSGGAGVSGNYGKHVILISIKNIYDGLYASKLHFVRVGLDERFTNVDKRLNTVNGNTVSTLYADLGSGYTMELTVNADNTVTITPTGDTNEDNLPGPFTQEGVNVYDPATKTFTLHYQYRAGARYSEETLEFISQ